MGTGKSRVGRLLAEKLNFEYMDTDTRIEEREEREIPCIFEENGEAYFRKVESEVLKEILNFQKQLVIATGGGIVLSAENRQLLQRETFPILLEASPSVIYNRIKDDDHRPLLSVKDPRQKISNLLDKRRHYYNCFSFSVNTDDLTPHEICDYIVNILEEKGLK